MAGCALVAIRTSSSTPAVALVGTGAQASSTSFIDSMLDDLDSSADVSALLGMFTKSCQEQVKAKQKVYVGELSKAIYERGFPCPATAEADSAMRGVSETVSKAMTEDNAFHDWSTATRRASKATTTSSSLCWA